MGGSSAIGTYIGKKIGEYQIKKYEESQNTFGAGTDWPCQRSNRYCDSKQSLIV